MVYQTASQITLQITKNGPLEPQGRQNTTTKINKAVSVSLYISFMIFWKYEWSHGLCLFAP